MDGWWTGLVTVAVIAVIYGLWFLFHDRGGILDPRLPGPPSPGYLGVAMALNVENHYAPHIHWIRKYGRMYKFTVLGGPTVGIADPALAEQVIMSKYCMDKPPRMYDTLNSIVGKTSLITVNGEKWKLRRRLLSKAFGLSTMRALLPVFNRASKTFVEVLGDLRTKESVNICPYTMRLAIDIILKSMFSDDEDTQRDLASPVPRAFKHLVQEYSLRCFNPLRQFNPVAAYRFHRQNAFLKARVQSIISLHREKLRTGLEGPQGGMPASHPDLVDLMLGARDEQTGEKFSDEDIYSQCRTFFFAGHDTTAHTLSWVLHEIAMHPEVEQRVVEEVDTVFGGKEALEWDDLKGLKVVTNVIKETLRLHPPAPLFLRQASEDFELGGYLIRKGTQLDIHSHAIHLDNEFWPDAMRFDPDRFTDANMAMRHPYAYLAFSQRERNCIGMTFAMLEMKIAIAMLYKHYVFRQDMLQLPRTIAKVTQLPSEVNVFIHKRGTLPPSSMAPNAVHLMHAASAPVSAGHSRRPSAIHVQGDAEPAQ